ncbi:hypothetical protein MJT46_009430 [Ovis ammon polii x Ovis aries]|nr:hypothetical protein MJT46_009430 [Ovis ammon polii x Ovis aries]
MWPAQHLSAQVLLTLIAPPVPSGDDGGPHTGDLSFHTAEEQTYELFSKSGDIKKIILGLDKMKKTACVFCFVGYDSRADAENTTRYINGTYLVDPSFSQTGMQALTRAGSLTVGVPGARNEKILGDLTSFTQHLRIAFTCMWPQSSQRAQSAGFHTPPPQKRTDRPPPPPPPPPHGIMIPEHRSSTVTMDFLDSPEERKSRVAFLRY